jgi:hypothetical protein
LQELRVRWPDRLKVAVMEGGHLGLPEAFSEGNDGRLDDAD